VKTLVRAAGAALAIALCSLPAARAAVVHGGEWSATYIAAHNPLFSGGVPYSGEMQLRFNHGIINGTYRGTSVRPDPLQGRIVPVSGTVSQGHITLNIGQAGVQSGGFSVTGTLAESGTISGTATQRGQLYQFLAKVKSSP
jgi:hypothetical protein